MSSSDNSQKKRNNYKLLVDPELRKGHKKLYRLNGKDVPGMPPVGQPEDPRTQKTVLGMAGSSMELAFPRFKYDKDWAGEPPERDVFVIGLSEAVKGAVLRETCSQLAPVHSMRFHHHPRTKTFLGAATVAFTYPGHGKKAAKELDGRIVGGCYLRAEVDDKGEHLKKYLEPVLKKCGLERKPLKSTSSDAEEGSAPRRNSTTESSHELSESETEFSSVGTPTTTGGRRSSETFIAPSATKLYPLSSLHLRCGGSSTPSAESPLSIVSPTPHTPSSLDSGVSSLRLYSTVSPVDKPRPHPLKTRPIHPPPFPVAPPPPLPPNDAPPLPPLEPPPLPPHSPRPPNNHGPPGGIENISSDEEAPPIIRDPRRASLTRPTLDVLSPVSISPPFSPKSVVRGLSHARPPLGFADPSLGLQTFVSAAAAKAPPPLPPSSVTPSYEPEVEDVSGDESPVMLYNSTPSYDIQVESVSSDEGGGEDMEVCSGDEDNLIEVNIPPPLLPPMYPPPLPPPHPGFLHPPHPLPFFAQPPPPQGFLPHPHPIFPPHPTLPPPPPGTMLPNFKSPPPFLHTPNGFIDFAPHTTRLLPSSRSAGKMKRDLATPPKNRQEGISLDVMYKALEQLRMILINDVQKKLVERYAYRALENYWKKMENRKQEQKTEGEEKLPYHVAPYRPGLKEEDGGRKERGGEDEATKEEEEEEAENIPTPRKRLMNFKIPIVNRRDSRRDQSASVVTRRRLFSDEEEPRERSGRKGNRLMPAASRRASYMEMTSDISSEELSEEDEEEEEEEEEEGSEEGYDVFGESSNEENEVDMLQKIFGESEDEEEGEESEMRDRPVTPTKTRAPGKKMREEMSQPTTTAPPSPPPTDDVLRPLTPPPEPLAPPTQAPPKEEPKRPMFKSRGEREEERSVREAREEPMDKEDIAMLRLALGRLREEGAGLVGGVNWAYHPNVSTGAPPPKRRRQDSQDLLVHATGCARSEGYYKIDARDKVKYLPHHRRKLRLNEKLEKKASSGRVNRAKLRRLASVFSTSDVSSDLAKYNQLKARKKLLKFSKSTIHNWGLFAIEAIAADEMVIEYVGEVVRQAVADERERRYEAAGIGSSYLFRVDHDYIIDATRNGNMARFINHCCDPNCYAKVISVGTQKKIVIYSKRDIAMGEEITYDYKFPIEEEKIPCLCGAPNCRGTLN